MEVDLDGLYNFYMGYTDKELDKWHGIIGSDVERDSFLTWCVKRNVCPWGIVNDNSRYWLDTINMFDGEMGLTLPFEYEHVPYIFYQALSIVRKERSDIAKEKEKNSGKQKNSDSNKR